MVITLVIENYIMSQAILYWKIFFKNMAVQTFKAAWFVILKEIS